MPADLHLSRTQIAVDLFADTHKVHVGILIFRLRALAHRLLSFGFEPFINTYAPRELVMLSTLMPGMQAKVILREAHERGDHALKSWILANAPEAVL